MLLELLDNILIIIKQIEKYEMKYRELDNDIRKTFFQKYINIIRVFYTNFNSIYICNRLLNKSINWNFQHNEIKHIENFWLLLLSDNWHNEFINQSKLSFIINTWSCFESDISLIFNEIVNNSEDIKIKRFEDEILKYTNLKVDENSYKEDFLSWTLKINNYYLSTNYKLRKILKELSFARNKRKDIENFCDFYMSTRNCIHNNSIYFWENKSFEDICWQDISFINWEEIKFATHDFLLNISFKLVEIFDIIISNINYKIWINDIYVEKVK